MWCQRVLAYEAVIATYLLCNNEGVHEVLELGVSPIYIALGTHFVFKAVQAAEDRFDDFSGFGDLDAAIAGCSFELFDGSEAADDDLVDLELFSASADDEVRKFTTLERVLQVERHRSEPWATNPPCIREAVLKGLKSVQCGCLWQISSSGRNCVRWERYDCAACAGPYLM